MNKLLTTIGLLFLSLQGFSTCIAIYIAPNGHIYVAADSRRTFFLDSNKTVIESVCKIHNVGDTWFAVSGFDDSALTHEANNALEHGGEQYLEMEAFGGAMTSHYQQLMDEAQRYYPEKLKEFLANGLADVAFFGYINDQPKVVEVQFSVNMKKNKPLVSFRIDNVAYQVVIGISKDIDNAPPDELPSKFEMLNKPEKYVEDLVKIEARKQPLVVGEPIDLLELKPGAALWLRRNEYTTAIQ